mmetsp:Transcript_104081/g.301102  ORF Transcript_104081/g.301102 Transcript_104081/m.301102 type:complete len:80 (+) Transcript_104081:159-398(+)
MKSSAPSKPVKNTLTLAMLKVIVRFFAIARNQHVNCESPGAQQPEQNGQSKADVSLKLLCLHCFSFYNIGVKGFEFCRP